MAKISKESFQFLKDIATNNNKPWFDENKAVYQASLENTKEFNQALFDKMQEHDKMERIKLYRIYRDVRFSKDKTPYKIYWHTGLVRATAQLRGGYYLHIQPNNESFIATGFWEPNKEDLFRIRKEFEMDDSEMRDILNDEKFK